MSLYLNIVLGISLVLFVEICVVSMADIDQVVQQLEALSGDDRRRAVSRLNLADRIVVETPSRPPPRKLRLFSGKSPVPSGEVDFDTWRLLVKQLEGDEHVSTSDKKSIILQNLLRPALDAVRSIDGDFKQILSVLDNLYGSVVDGTELLIQFHTTYQNEKESASSYLQRIYLLLMETADKGGVSVADIPKFLIKQFIRGSSDEGLISKLKLDDKVDDPPSFADFLLSVRVQESKATEKRLRLKVAERSPQLAESSIVSDLRGKVAQLEAQLCSLSAQSSKEQSKHVDSKPVVKTPAHPKKSNVGRKRSSPRSFFCYRCGEDGHHFQECKKDKNPSLVQEKLQARYQPQEN